MEDDDWVFVGYFPSPHMGRYLLYTNKGCGKHVYDNGVIEYTNERNQFHRIGGPARIVGDVKRYYVNGSAMSREEYLKHFDSDE